MFGSFNATQDGLMLIYATLIITGVFGLLSTILGFIFTRNKPVKPALWLLITLLPSVVTTIMLFITRTEHLGLDVIWLGFFLPPLLLAVHVIPLLILYLLSRSDPAIRRTRGWIVFAGFIADLLALGITGVLGLFLFLMMKLISNS